MKPSSPGLLSYRRWSQFLEILFISQRYSKLDAVNCNIPCAFVCNRSVVSASTRSDQNNPIPGFGRPKAGTRRNYGREESKA